MTVTSHEIIVSVEKNHLISVSEADWRGICSRSYYAIYEDGKDFHGKLSAPGILRAESRGGMHRDLIEQLCKPGLKRSDPDYLRSMKIGYLMKTLHEQRIKSDYFRSKAIAKVDADNCIAQAKGVLVELSGGGVVTKPHEHDTFFPACEEKRTGATLTRIK